ncbi:MAG: hypothetical protein KIS87_02410 [Phycisphaeraceae bacterium]|nr:hypothetical protein [Phycisphaeraceae bacterium]
MTETRHIPRPAAAAFSLVEVLIAVFVLALGLLGLGAVFPVVVREQRLATDATLGLGAMNSIKADLSARADLLRFDPTTGVSQGGWVEWIKDVSQQSGLPLSGPWGPRPGWASAPIDPASGVVTLGTGSNAVEIPVGARLFPAPHTEGVDPRFVWDFAGVRVPRGDPADASDDAVMVALFLRRIDPGIRLPLIPGQGRLSLSRALTETASSLPNGVRDLRSPVAVRSTDGRPTFTGVDDSKQPNLDRRNYALPLVVELLDEFPGSGVYGVERDVIALKASTDSQRRFYEQLLSQSGQRFVDVHGHVYRIVSVIPPPPGSMNIPMAFRIDPPVPNSVARLPEGESVKPRDISPIVFLPQPPVVDPVVFVIEP